MQNLSNLTSECVVCEGEVKLGRDTQVSEVVSCLECKSSLVVEEMNSKGIILSKAPVVEEDWGQ